MISKEIVLELAELWLRVFLQMTLPGRATNLLHLLLHLSIEDDGPTKADNHKILL